MEGWKEGNECRKEGRGKERFYGMKGRKEGRKARRKEKIHNDTEI